MGHAGRKGFSLIELLIVVAIILIIAAIAIPNLLRSRIAANEASAVSSLRMLNSAEVTFVLSYGSGYPATLNQLGPPPSGQADANHADMVDQILSGFGPGGTPTTFIKAGYLFTYTPLGGTFPNISSYQITADPSARGNTGQKSYFTNEPLLIRYNATTTCSASDPPL